MKSSNVSWSIQSRENNGQVLKLSPDDRATAFINTGYDKGLSPAIVEKDFWVCLILDYLFSKSELKASYSFKGGTSLSKCFNLINRFSEDIDLIIDWRLLGYGKDEPWEPRSNTKQDIFVEKINADAATFLADTLIQKISDDLQKLVSEPCNVSIDESDPQTLIIEYPRRFSDTSILPDILNADLSGFTIALLLLVSTGMRRGEDLGLIWKHVDFDSSAVFIANQYASDKTLRPPKSKESRRWLSISEEVAAILASW